MSASPAEFNTRARSRLRGRPAVVLGFLALLLVAAVLRRPDAVTNAQFWAEDGHFWFADAYNDGALASLARPEVGYFQTLSRLAGIVAVPLGLHLAPLFFNVAALTFQLLPAFLITTSRFEPAIPSFQVRLLLGAMYVVIPNYEVHANVTNAQWHVALLGLMVLVAALSPRWRWRVFDVAVLVLAGLSGPFVFLLLPVAAIRWWLMRDRRHLVPVALTAALALVQGLTAVLTISGRSQAPLGAGVAPAARIITDRVVIPGLLGQENPSIYTQALHHGLLLAIPIAGIAAALFLAAMLLGPWELRLLNGFALFSLLLALLKPQVSLSLPQWPLMAATTGGARYFLLPMVAWMVTVVWAVSKLPPRPRIAVGAVLALALGTGAALHWQYPPYTDFRPQTYARQFDVAPAGSRLEIPLNPPGWTMTLTKR